MRNIDLINVLNNLSTLKAVKGSTFVFKLGKNIRKIREHVETIEAMKEDLTDDARYFKEKYIDILIRVGGTGTIVDPNSLNEEKKKELDQAIEELVGVDERARKGREDILTGINNYNEILMKRVNVEEIGVDMFTPDELPQDLSLEQLMMIDFMVKY